jgi:sugar phosphate isomerase/epimerase
VGNIQNIICDYLEIYKNIEIYSMHGPFVDLSFGSIDNLIMEATEKRFEYTYQVSCKLKINNIVLHNGYIPDTKAPSWGTTYPPNWIKRSKLFWDNFLQNKELEKMFYIENFMEYNPDIILELLTKVNRKNFKMCFDVGHANIFSKIGIIKWIEIVNENIGFVHLHNNNGETDEHAGINNGKINMLEICNSLEEYSPNAIWAIETKECEESIEWLIRNKFIK